MTRIQRDTSAYIFVVLASVFLLTWAIPNHTPAYPGYGAPPALVPNVVVGVMLVMALLALVRNALAIWGEKPLSKTEGEYPEDGDSGGFTQIGRVNLLHLARFIIPAALLIPGFNWIGFIPTSIIFLLLLQYLVGCCKPVIAIVVALVTVAVMYVAMRYGFGVPVPGA